MADKILQNLIFQEFGNPRMQRDSRQIPNLNLTGFCPKVKFSCVGVAACFATQMDGLKMPHKTAVSDAQFASRFSAATQDAQS